MKLFIHIPKTAGTSLRKTLSRYYGKRIAYAYGDNELTHPILKTNSSPEEKRAALEAQGFKLIFGHVQYKHWASAFKRDEVLAVLRHPVDRCLSHYQHYLSKPDNTELARKVHEERLSIQEFARYPHIANLQANTLGINRNIFDRLSEFGALYTDYQLASELGVKWRLNKLHRSFQVNASDILAIQEINLLDLQVYELVRQAWCENYWCWPNKLRRPKRLITLR